MLSTDETRQPLRLATLSHFVLEADDTFRERVYASTQLCELAAHLCELAALTRRSFP